MREWQWSQDDRSIDFSAFKTIKDGLDTLGTVQLDELKSEVCVGVCFGPTGGEKTTVRVVGSSCERLQQKRERRASKDLWDEDNKVGISDKPKGAVGMEELNGS